MAAPAQQIQPYDQGVKVVTTEAGDGKTYPKAGNNLTMHYVGKFHGGAKHGYLSHCI